MMYPLHLLKTRFFFPFCIWFIHFLWNLFCLFFLVVAGVGEDDSRRPGGGPRSQQQQQAQMNQTLHSELALSKEQLYDLFQQILGVKKFEHQLLFNALQVRIYVDYTIFIINICYEKEFVDGKWLLNDRHKKIFVKTIFFFRLAAGFVGRTSRRHPKRTRRSTAKSGGNGKGSFFFFISRLIVFCLDQRIRTEAMRIRCSFCFLFTINPITFPHLPLVCTTHVNSVFWAIDIYKSVMWIFDAQWFPPHHFLVLHRQW